MEQWEIERCSGTCAVTGKELAEGEEYYSVLFEEGESFRRADYCLDAWEGAPEGAFCFFRTRVPVKTKKKRLLVDNDVLINFFLRLAGEQQESRVHFRFVLALILMRKRILRYEETVREEDQEYWVMRLAKEPDLHRVVNPRLNDEQIESVSRELGVILHGDMGDFDALDAAKEEAEAESASDSDVEQPTDAAGDESQAQAIEDE